MNKLKICLIIPITIIFVMLTTNFANSMDIGNQIPIDKRMHILLMYAGNDGMATVFKWNWLERLAATTVLGIVKENLDAANGGEFSDGDIVANTVGFMCYELVHVKIEW